MGTHSMAEPPPNPKLRHDIRATTPSRIHRMSHWMKRPESEMKETARHGYNEASKQHAEMIDRRPPPPSVSDGWRGTTRGKQARGTRQGGKRIERGTIARRNSTVSARLPAHRVARRGERRRSRPDRRDEERDEPQASRTSQHAPHNEMRTPSPSSRADRQAGRGASQRKQHEPVIDIGTNRRAEPSKQDTDAPRLTPRPTVSKSGEETGETMTDEMGRMR